MRIGFFGAGGTGKTTLAKAVASALNLPFCPSTTRSVYAKYNKTQKDMPQLSPELRRVIQLENFAAKIEHDKANPLGIFDRTLLDHLMYVLLYCHDTLADSEYQSLLSDTWKNLSQYSVLFYFPIYQWPVSLAEDGFREAGLVNRMMQQSIINGMLQVVQQNHGKLRHLYTIPDASVEKRVSIVTAFQGLSTMIDSSFAIH